MPRSRKRRLLTALAWLAAMGALGYLGNKAGHLLARAGYFRGAAEDHNTEATPPRDGSGRPQRPRGDTTPARTDVVDAALDKLRNIQRNSITLYTDWEAKAAIRRVLDGLSPEELGALYARLESRDEDGWFEDLSKLVGARWAASDPDAAMRAAMAKSKWRGGYFATGVFRDWAAEHPRQALAWLDEGEMDPELLERRDEMRAVVIGGLVERDFTLAAAELAKLDAKAAKDVWQHWGDRYVEDAAMREKLIEHAKGTGRPQDFAALNDRLVNRWPENDPLGLTNHLLDLQEYLESDAVPAAARRETDAAAVGAAIGREYHEAGLEWWMGRYSQSTETPQALKHAVSFWSDHKPEVAAGWLAAQPESPQRDALSAAAAPSFIRKGNFPKAAEIIDGISDPAIRQAGIERLEILWKEKDPAAAKAWRDARGE